MILSPYEDAEILLPIKSLSMSGQSVIRNKNIHIIFGITLLAVMGVASITPAIPTIADHFNIDYKKIGLLITVFTLPGFILTPIMGILADHLGRKTILVPSLFIFAIAGFLCSQVDNFQHLLILRSIQGVGAASLGSLNLTLIGDLFPREQRATAMGFNSSVLSIGTALYPLIGGAITVIGWNYPFLLPLLAIPVGIIIIFYLETPCIQKEDNFRKYFLNTISSIAKTEVIALFLLNIMTFIILYGSYLTYFPIAMRTNFSSGPFIIGIIMSASSFTTAITSSMLGSLTKRFKQKNMLKLAYFLYSLSLIFIIFLDKPFLMLIPACIFGIAQGINIPNIQTLLVNLAPEKSRAAFMSLNGMVLRGGQTLGPIVAGAFYAYGGVDYAFICGISITVIMLIIVYTMIR